MTHSSSNSSQAFFPFEQTPVLPPSTSNTLDAIAGAVLSGHRLVSYDATARMVYADFTTAENVVGLSMNAAALNGAVTIALSETEITHAGWSWIPGNPLFLGVNGNISQTAPLSGFSVRVGEAITATRIFFRIEPAISL